MSVADASLISDEDMEIAHNQLAALEKETPVKYNSNQNWFMNVKASFQVWFQLNLEKLLMRSL